MKLLIKNGIVIDYANKTNGKKDILVQDGKIAKVEDSISEEMIDPNSDKVVDCTGLYVMPGMIDIHCHLREPGGEHKETLVTGTKSAVSGGFTTICPMPNTNPVPDNPTVLRQIRDKAKSLNLCNVLPFSSVTIGEKGEGLVDFKAQLDAGAVAFSDDGMPVENARMIREAMIKANELGSFISEHCEEKSVSSGAINAGPVADKLGVQGVLPEAEEIMAARDIVIAETNNLHTHICHISTSTSVNMIRSAKARGVKVTCETCPHYYSFTVDEVLVSGVNAKMNPPLREKKDLIAIIKGLKDGTIDCIITDHAPHAEDEKAKGLEKAPNGIIGFETALSATITNLVKPGYLDYFDIVRLMSYNPAKLMGLNKGEISVGKDADFTIFDPNKEYKYTRDSIVSKSKNSPWIGKTLIGQVQKTIVGGKIVFKR